MLMRKILEPAFLEQLGLIRDTFTKIGIRQTTNILYRQANYNLLREETEGYSKLATELFTTSNSEPPTAETVQATFERVKGLIGTFDLDVGRALDVTLDVFGSVLIKQFRFFVKFLRISSWWPRTQVRAGSIGTTFVGGLPKWGLPESSHWLTSEEDETVIVEQRRLRDVQFWERAREVHLDAYFELGGRQVANNELKRLQDMVQAASNGELNKDIDPEIQWIVNTRTLPPSGNRIAAQLLGFKLRFYDSDAKDDSDVLPANIFYMAALLIKIGFISLCDLYPHVSPADDGMEAVREARMKLLAEEERAKTGKTNALAMLGVLPEDEKDVQRTNKLNAEMRAAAAAAAAAKVKPVEVIYQKVQLLEELLTVGAIPEALFILGRFPWLPEAFPKLLNYIHRLLHSSLEKVYCECRPATRASIDTNLKKLPESDQSAVPKGSIKITPVPSKRPLRWPHPDGEKDGAPYRCYWDEWADNVPVCQTVDDVFTLCGTLMNLSGVNIGKDEALLSKLAVIGTKSLATDQSQQNRDRWQDLLKRLIVPALSLTSSNSATVNAVWNMLNLYPTTVRYNMYAEWYKGATSRQPAMRAAFARTKSETLSVLKRVSTQNISTMSRKLAKAAFASPGVVFDTAIEQLESYPNLIPAFVECARYFTDMGYDILVWSLMSALGGNRSRTQAGSILYTSEWLKSLSKLSGQVFKRYNNMRPTPVLQYVNDQLFKGNSTDLVLLRELISSMAGVVPDADFTDAQLKSMTGGEVLRRQTLIHLGDRRFESTRGAKRLMQALIDTKLAGGLLINLAQYRQSGVFKVPESQAHIKYLSSLLDDAHQAFMQYLDLLRSNLSADQFDSLIPGIIALVQDFGLDVSFAFMIGRASLAYRMSNPKSPALGSVKDDQSQLTLPATDAEGDLSMTEEDVSVQPVAPVNDKMVLDDTPVNGSAAPVAQTPRKSDPLLDSLQPIIEGIQPILSPEIWARLSPEFFVMFWSLQLSDLSVPQTNYMAEHDRLNKAAEDVMKDRSDMTRNGMNKKDKEKRALLDVASSIREEMKAHVERYQKTRFRLAKQSKSWFPGAIADVNAISDTLIEQCLLPRMLLSATDTEYCFRVIKFLHENRAPNFKLSSLYERFFNANRLRSMIFSCSVREAEYLGRFIKLILEDLSRWQGDQNLYEKEALGQKGETRNYIGFATAFDDDGKPTAFIDHTSFRDSHYEWHKNLNSALKSCLQDTEWMHIRNALTVLKTITSYFPAVNFMGKNLMVQLEAIRLREQASTKASEASDDKRAHRVDLAVTAQTTASALIKRTTQWVMVQAFRTNASAKEKEASKDADAASSTLRPTAPEFKPQPAKSNVTQATEVEEDGEVQDGKDAKAAESSDSLAPKPNPSSRRSSVSGVEDKGKDLDAKDLTAAPAARPTEFHMVYQVVQMYHFPATSGLIDMAKSRSLNEENLVPAILGSKEMPETSEILVISETHVILGIAEIHETSDSQSMAD
ncbi:putative tho2 protein [Phaeoacremonium minimum UCRPA7]|uniref:THO complex subunit 2 n=1 Tax=Phaeoacremonium minimum (strain UCR-PA7) TaxID=1286976 RepID=R8BUR5_PHAM7|nr:putative tho2 protein [Phaeoacremonium minimum UCRPA7]EOO03102.1 putative tho2 protein [Phaeoacremonium minimum UCRPA7]